MAGYTTNPDTVWFTQQAYQRVWELDDPAQSIRILIHDRDPKFPIVSDRVFVSEGIKIVRTPFRAPKANAFAERWVRSVREVCLDPILILNESHFYRTISEYVDDCNLHSNLRKMLQSG